MNKPLSLVKSACFECFGARGFALGGGDEVSLTRTARKRLSVVSWVMGTANRVKGRAVVILSVDATHFLMASEDSDVVGMKAVQQTPQGLRAMYGDITPAFSGSP
jgi:hypothetical protein